MSDDSTPERDTATAAIGRLQQRLQHDPTFAAAVKAFAIPVSLAIVAQTPEDAPTDTEMVLVEFAIPVSLYSLVEDMADEIVTIRAERDAAVKALPPDDAERFICLAHPHNNRWEEALCSAKYQLDAAVRERDMWQRRALSRIALQAECDDLRARLAALTYAADTMISWQGTHRECDAWDKLRAAVAAETWRGAHRSPQVIRRGRSER